MEFTIPNLDQEAKYWTIYIDGSSITGFGVVGIIITTLEKDTLRYGVQLQFPMTNNEAEYEAVLTSLRIAKAVGVKSLKLKTDSKLVVGQMTNGYEAKEERMKNYLKLVTQLIDEFDEVKVEQIPLKENSTTNEIARLTSTEDASTVTGLLMEVQTNPSIDGLHTFLVQQSDTWMDPILSYIRNGQLPSNSPKAKKVRVKVARFTVMNGELYKRGFSLPYLKCLTPEEAMYVLHEIHEEVCGNHSRPRSLVGKTIKASYFWLTMQKDVIELVKKCDKCQHFENVQHIPRELLTSISSPWPFPTWGIDIVSPLPQGKK